MKYDYYEDDGEYFQEPTLNGEFAYAAHIESALDTKEREKVGSRDGAWRLERNWPTGKEQRNAEGWPRRRM